ncbi:MAG: hypothetical protein ACI4DP_13000 [Candidatus Ornithomonoglobus sp.]
MKRFSKLILSVAAVSAVSAAMAISAMAADTLSGTYNAETGEVTLTGAVATGASQTLLVLNNNADSVTADDIAQIDQVDEEGYTFTSFKLQSGLETGTYYIRIGGDGSIQTGTLTIGGGTGGVETVTLIVGDANLDGAADITDVGYILRAANFETSRISHVGEVFTKAADNSQVIVGDANLDGAADITDVGYILRAANFETSRISHVGESIEVISE